MIRPDADPDPDPWRWRDTARDPSFRWDDEFLEVHRFKNKSLILVLTLGIILAVVIDRSRRRSG